jgi:hypothetical protein
MGGPLPDWCDRTCVVCPGQLLGPGDFDVVDRPGRQYAFRPEVGYRVGPEGTAVCVHPYRVGMPPGRYASAGDPLPDLTAPPPVPSEAARELPAAYVDLEGWLIAVLRDVDQPAMATAVHQAETIAARHFTPGQVARALRRVLTIELAGG